MEFCPKIKKEPMEEVAASATVEISNCVELDIFKISNNKILDSPVNFSFGGLPCYVKNEVQDSYSTLGQMPQWSPMQFPVGPFWQNMTGFPMNSTMSNISPARFTPYGRPSVVSSQTMKSKFPIRANQENELTTNNRSSPSPICISPASCSDAAISNLFGFDPFDITQFKPELSWRQIVALTILATGNRYCTQMEMYKFIKLLFPYYPLRMKDSSWKSSVRAAVVNSTDITRDVHSASYKIKDEVVGQKALELKKHLERSKVGIKNYDNIYESLSQYSQENVERSQENMDD